MAEKRQLPTLYVVQIGNDEFERFVIEDQQDRVWTGKRFDSEGGALFAKHNDAAVESQNILRSHFKGEPMRYVVPLFIEVYSHGGPVNVADVAQYLSGASRLYIDTTEHGNGPDDALVLPRIEWHRIKQRSSPNE